MGCGHHVTPVRLPKAQETNHLYIILSGTAAAARGERPLLVRGCHTRYICVQPVAHTPQKQLRNVQVPEVT